MNDTQVQIKWSLPEEIALKEPETSLTARKKSLPSENWWRFLPSANSVSSNLQFVKTITFISKPLFKDESFLRQKYEVERLRPVEIAKLAFSSRQTIKKYLTHYKIVLRSEDTRTRKVPPFGLKILRYRERLHKAEQKTIQKISSLRNQGLSYQQIANTLNAVGFKTRMQRGGWHANTVMDIEKRTAKTRDSYI